MLISFAVIQAFVFRFFGSIRAIEEYENAFLELVDVVREGEKNHKISLEMNKGSFILVKK